MPAAAPVLDDPAVDGFDLDTYLAQFNADALVRSAEYRRAVTRVDPLAFALVYVAHHLRGEATGNRITLSEFHLDVCEQAKRWVLPDGEPGANRDAYVAPRDAGKTTWWFLVLPLWAAAHEHRKFIAAFADSGSQAEQHLATFKLELESNELLRQDFPELCSPRKTRTGGAVANRQNLYMAESGFAFGAKGIDASSLGMKIEQRRPDLIIFDDVEPDESNYSPYQKEKRLGTIIDAILPLNIYARVVLIGTVTMPGSIVHELVKTITSPGEDHEKWIGDENWRVHYYPPILRDEVTGVERSLWPAKWPLEYLQSIRHTRSYKKNFLNDPMARDGVYWSEDDITHAELPALTHQIISIDPAVTSKKTSDFTAIAVVAYSAHHGRVVVRDAWAIRVPPGEQLRARVLAILELYPETRGIVVEVNQGGDTWKTSVLKGMPVPVKTVHQDEPKEVRAARLLNWYQTRPWRRPGDPKPPEDAGLAGLPYVIHARPLPVLEEQLVGFPNAPHDDLVDAVGTGVDMFLQLRKQKRQIKSTTPGSTPDED